MLHIGSWKTKNGRQLTLAIWRTLGKSPRFIKVGKLVRYHERDIHTWLDANTHANTSHRGFQAY